MRITKVNISKDNNNGLEDIKMEKLTSIVLISGKNGAGKTRIPVRRSVPLRRSTPGVLACQQHE